MKNVSIILVGSLYDGNIGSVARVIANFGFQNLILVNPCKIGNEAENMAVHAKPILNNAKICNNFESAIKNFDLVVGTTAKSAKKDYRFLRITITPAELAKKLEKIKGDVAIVFGPEDSGLKNEELERCDIGVTIPTSEEYESMNVSHSVAVILYELAKNKNRKLQPGQLRIASKREKDIIVKKFGDIVEKIKYPKSAGRRKVFNLMIAKLIGRAQVTGREANTLIGVLKKIKYRLKGKIN